MFDKTCAYYTEMNKYIDACRMLEEGLIFDGYEALKELDSSFEKVGQLMGICEEYMPYVGVWKGDCKFHKVGETPKSRENSIGVWVYINTDDLTVKFADFNSVLKSEDEFILKGDSLAEKGETHKIFNLTTGEYDYHFWNYNDASLEYFESGTYRHIDNTNNEIGLYQRISKYDLINYEGEWSCTNGDAGFWGNLNPDNEKDYIFIYRSGNIDISLASNPDNVLMTLTINPENGSFKLFKNSTHIDEYYLSEYATFKEKHSNYQVKGFDRPQQYPDLLIFTDSSFDNQYVVKRK